ncbi:amidase [Rhodococcus rhodnii]|uniref:amidase n=1 Tax=Rhodococcus rhodnii LMG 5362 TaxID=1273125 RepID=R7WI76_9NOCA|nr:amidase [Rhodococcus rhodnii]EOM74865.1 putative amidase [Rhodococcus rhodnii LMG 5362]
MTDLEDLAGLTATELAALYRSAQVSPEEATAAVLERIDRHDSTVNAYCVRDDEFALEEARSSAKRWLAGEPKSLLDGVPISIKDIFLTAGRPTRRGSKTVDPDQPWPEDAPVVARVRESGAVIVGKTTTPEFAWKGVTDSPLTGITRNPWNPATTAGGSSGGAGAAVAAGMAPLALGTDGGGSVRIPASFCGVTTLKPTYGAIPLFPSSPFGTLAHAGPMTRTVADTAALMDVVTGFDARDWSALPQPAVPYVQALAEVPEDAPLEGVRIAYSRDLGFATVDPEVDAIVEKAVGVLADLGARVDAVDPGFADEVWAFECLWFAGAAKATEHLTEQQRELLDPGLAEICRQGLTYSAQDYLEAMARRMALGLRMGTFHETYDLLVTPTVPIVAFEAGVEVPPGSSAERWTSWTPFTYPFNLTQQPAASVPCGFSAAGLPVGLQIVAARHGDQRVLAAAHAYERATDWHTRRPPLG